MGVSDHLLGREAVAGQPVGGPSDGVRLSCPAAARLTIRSRQPGSLDASGLRTTGRNHSSTRS
eukprot:4513796-Alexandrium_andersonii.AAC.1